MICKLVGLLPAMSIKRGASAGFCAQAIGAEAQVAARQDNTVRRESMMFLLKFGLRSGAAARTVCRKAKVAHEGA